MGKKDYTSKLSVSFVCNRLTNVWQTPQSIYILDQDKDSIVHVYPSVSLNTQILVIKKARDRKFSMKATVTHAFTVGCHAQRPHILKKCVFSIAIVSDVQNI